MIINEIMDTIKSKKSILVLGKDEKANKKIYDNLISLFQKEKETRRLEDYLVCHIVGNESKKKFVEFYEKNTESPFLAFLTTEKDFPEEFEKYNTKSYIEKEFDKAKEYTNVFLDFDYFYSLSNNYGFFLNVGKLNSKE
jgi:hypothetical protein